MARKLLIALDSSEGAWRAVEYVADTFGPTPGVQVTLLHILSSLPRPSGMTDTFWANRNRNPGSG